MTHNVFADITVTTVHYRVKGRHQAFKLEILSDWTLFASFPLICLLTPILFFFGNLNNKNEFFRNERWIESTQVSGVGVVCSLFNKINSTKCRK